MNSCRRLAATTALLAVVAVACGPPPPSTVEPPPGDSPRAGEAAYLEVGPFDVGVTTVDLGGRLMEIWYPAGPAGTATASGAVPDRYDLIDLVDPSIAALVPEGLDTGYDTTAYRDLDIADTGPFPLVLFSHGFLGFRQQSTALTSHIASWGFVVASPDFLERGLSSFGGSAPSPSLTDRQVLDLAASTMTAKVADPADRFYGTTDASRFFPIGHSAGGGASTDFARRPDVDAWISLSAGARAPWFEPLPDNPQHTKAAMWLIGRNDRTAPPSSAITAHDWTPGPSKLFIIDGAGHNNAVTDICSVGGGGGAVGLAVAAGIPLPPGIVELGNDGCLPPNLPPAEVQPVAHHLVTAELRYRAGLDLQPVGLGDGVLDEFSPIVVEYRHDP